MRALGKYYIACIEVSRGQLVQEWYTSKVRCNSFTELKLPTSVSSLSYLSL